jgi:DNA-binding CsgD family transcriptional regulator
LSGIIFLLIKGEIFLDIILNAIQFTQASLLFAAVFFAGIMFFRTKDPLAGRTLFLLVPVAAILIISYFYNITTIYADIEVAQAQWLSPMFAMVVIFLIMVAILAACYYTIQIFPISKKQKRYGFVLSTIIVAVLLISTTVLVMYLSAEDLDMAVTNALWAFYPLCSLALFLLAIAVVVMLKNITNSHHQRLAKYFLIAFMPQIVFSFIDFFLMQDLGFQFTHLSYTVFSVLVFADLCAYFFRSYNNALDIADKEQSIQKAYNLSSRELEVMELLAQGQTNRAIADQLHISVNTVKSHIKNIYEKMAVSNRLQLVNLLNQLKTGVNS